MGLKVKSGGVEYFDVQPSEGCAKAFAIRAIGSPTNTLELQDRNGNVCLVVDDDGVTVRSIRSAAYKNANTARNSTTTLAADPDLVIDLPFEGVFKIECMLFYSEDDDFVGINLGFDGSVSLDACMIAVDIHDPVAGSVSPLGVITSLADDPLGNTTLNAGDGWITIVGSVVVSNPGYIQLYWAQGASNALDLTIRSSSYLLGTQLKNNV